MLSRSAYGTMMESKWIYIRNYLIVILMILSSKTVYFGLIYVRLTYLALSGICVISLIFSIHHKTKIKLDNLIVLFVIFVEMTMQFLAYNDQLSSSFIHTFVVTYLPFIISFFCTALLTKESYLIKYVNVLIVISLVSLVCFSIAVLNPELAWAFITKTEFNNSIYNISPFYTWGWGIHVFARNSGPFWEPGAFQGFIIMAVLFMLFTPGKHKHVKFKMFVLLATMITTGSTTGYILTIVVLFIFHKRFEKLFLEDRSLRGKNWIKFVVVIMTVGVLFYIVLSNNISDKLVNTNISGMTRKYDFLNGFNVVFDHPFIGYSFTNARITRLGELGMTTDISVGLSSLLFTCGIPFGLYYLWRLYGGLKAFFHPTALEWAGLIVVFVILNCTEVLWWLPVYTVFLFRFSATKEKYID